MGTSYQGIFDSVLLAFQNGVQPRDFIIRWETLALNLQNIHKGSMETTHMQSNNIRLFI